MNVWMNDLINHLDNELMKEYQKDIQNSCSWSPSAVVCVFLSWSLLILENPTFCSFSAKAVHWFSWSIAFPFSSQYHVSGKRTSQLHVVSLTCKYISHDVLWLRLFRDRESGHKFNERHYDTILEQAKSVRLNNDLIFRLLIKHQIWYAVKSWRLT